jgi:hypothetical protein
MAGLRAVDFLDAYILLVQGRRVGAADATYIVRARCGWSGATGVAYIQRGTRLVRHRTCWLEDEQNLPYKSWVCLLTMENLMLEKSICKIHCLFNKFHTLCPHL